jgi:hypothetical protein
VTNYNLLCFNSHQPEQAKGSIAIEIEEEMMSPESKKRKKAMAAIEERNQRLDKLVKGSKDKRKCCTGK